MKEYKKVLHNVKVMKRKISSQIRKRIFLKEHLKEICVTQENTQNAIKRLLQQRKYLNFMPICSY